MLELTLRDAMVIVGSLLILAVVIDAWRRMRQQARSRVRMKLAAAAVVVDEEPREDLAFYRELPNGGARVVSREDLLGTRRAPQAASAAPGDPGDGVQVQPPETVLEQSSATATAPAPESVSAGDELLAGMSATDEPANMDWLE
ncbi:MAG: cell division protein ZipA, partial [Halieaceae bacterium]